MKRLVVNSPDSEIDISRCGTSKWYGYRSSSGNIYVLTSHNANFIWACMSSLNILNYNEDTGFDAALEAGKRAGEVFQFDSLAELGLWLTENG